MFSFTFPFCIRHRVFVYNPPWCLEPKPIFVKFCRFLVLHDPTATFLFQNLRICFQFEFVISTNQFIFALEFVKIRFRLELRFFVLRVKWFRNVSFFQKRNIQPVTNPIPKWSPDDVVFYKTKPIFQACQHSMRSVCACMRK